jgi:hypothetical protein
MSPTPVRADRQHIKARLTRLATVNAALSGPVADRARWR